MSLYSALYAGVAGLGAEATAMAVVADNISNINTIGYKGNDIQFRTLVSDGRAKSTYTAGGVMAAPQALISKQGLLQASSNTTDLGIEGGGFFVVRQSLDGDDVAFTRAGSFRPDEFGFLRNASGMYLQGWRLDSFGEFTNTGNVQALTPVRVSDLTGAAAPTTKIDVRANLQSTATAFTGVYNSGDMATGVVTPSFSRSFDIFDAQGTSHRVTMAYVRTGPNTWQGELYAEPATDVTTPNGVLASGELRFNPDGSLIRDDAVYTSDLFDPVDVTWSNAAGSVPIRLGLGENGTISGLSQFGSESAMIAATTDGGVLGNIASIQVSEAGLLSAVFDNGVTRPVFQLPVATFPNPDGLTRISGNAYLLSDKSGNASIDVAGALGAGTIRSSTLEASTVDLAQEFSNMIRFQRAYSAASKIITTVDDMLAEVSNLKR
ncbi:MULTISPECIES: flagellar hook protein FlgE [unclassified Sphingomonas]|uniref:flagellar hook protein FlgE n=1 Tax=unclassified Sphingomonas TaxID=196159 RepID=UPI002150ED9E|nr:MULTISPECIES: flagellar hook protein FlgE [unclassified Sphingomonas]